MNPGNPRVFLLGLGRAALLAVLVAAGIGAAGATIRATSPLSPLVELTLTEPLTTMTDARGCFMFAQLDKRLRALTLPLGDGMTVTAEIDEAGNRSEYEYDAAGRRTLIRDALGGTNTFEYDPTGRVFGMVDAAGRAPRCPAARCCHQPLPPANPASPMRRAGCPAWGRPRSDCPACCSRNMVADAISNLAWR